MTDPQPAGLGSNLPKIKKQSSKDNVRSVVITSRDAQDILSTTQHSYLDSQYSGWDISAVKLINNKELEEQYRTKRAELKEDGKHSRDVQDVFAFHLVKKENVINQIAQHGLCTRPMSFNALGDSKLGVHVCRHADVQLRLAETWGCDVCHIVVFKVILGKCKILSSQGGSSDNAEPTPNYDCHISKTKASPSDPVLVQAARSQIYLYEYNDDCESVSRPRHCLPHAVVSYTKNSSTSTETKAKGYTSEKSTGYGRIRPSESSWSRGGPPVQTDVHAQPAAAAVTRQPSWPMRMPVEGENLQGQIPGRIPPRSFSSDSPLGYRVGQEQLVTPSPALPGQPEMVGMYQIRNDPRVRRNSAQELEELSALDVDLRPNRLASQDSDSGLAQMMDYGGPFDRSQSSNLSADSSLNWLDTEGNVSFSGAVPQDVDYRQMYRRQPEQTSLGVTNSDMTYREYTRNRRLSQEATTDDGLATADPRLNRTVSSNSQQSENDKTMSDGSPPKSNKKKVKTQISLAAYKARKKQEEEAKASETPTPVSPTVNPLMTNINMDVDNLKNILQSVQQPTEKSEEASVRRISTGEASDILGKIEKIPDVKTQLANLDVSNLKLILEKATTPTETPTSPGFSSMGTVFSELDPAVQDGRLPEDSRKASDELIQDNTRHTPFVESHDEYIEEYYTRSDKTEQSSSSRVKTERPSTSTSMETEEEIGSSSHSNIEEQMSSLQSKIEEQIISSPHLKMEKHIASASSRRTDIPASASSRRTDIPASASSRRTDIPASASSRRTEIPASASSRRTEIPASASSRRTEIPASASSRRTEIPASASSRRTEIPASASSRRTDITSISNILTETCETNTSTVTQSEPKSSITSIKVDPTNVPSVFPMSVSGESDGGENKLFSCVRSAGEFSSDRSKIPGLSASPSEDSENMDAEQESSNVGKNSAKITSRVTSESTPTKNKTHQFIGESIGNKLSPIELEDSDMGAISCDGSFKSFPSSVEGSLESSPIKSFSEFHHLTPKQLKAFIESQTQLMKLYKDKDTRALVDKEKPMEKKRQAKPRTGSPKSTSSVGSSHKTKENVSCPADISSQSNSSVFKPKPKSKIKPNKDMIGYRRRKRRRKTKKTAGEVSMDSYGEVDTESISLTSTTSSDYFGLDDNMDRLSDRSWVTSTPSEYADTKQYRTGCSLSEYGLSHWMQAATCPDFQPKVILTDIRKRKCSESTESLRSWKNASSTGTIELEQDAGPACGKDLHLDTDDMYAKHTEDRVKQWIQVARKKIKLTLKTVNKPENENKDVEAGNVIPVYVRQGNLPSSPVQHQQSETQQQKDQSEYSVPEIKSVTDSSQDLPSTSQSSDLCAGDVPISSDYATGQYHSTAQHQEQAGATRPAYTGPVVEPTAPLPTTFTPVISTYNPVGPVYNPPSSTYNPSVSTYAPIASSAYPQNATAANAPNTRLAQGIVHLASSYPPHTQPTPVSTYTPHLMGSNAPVPTFPPPTRPPMMTVRVQPGQAPASSVQPALGVGLQMPQRPPLQPPLQPPQIPINMHHPPHGPPSFDPRLQNTNQPIMLPSVINQHTARQQAPPLPMSEPGRPPNPNFQQTRAVPPPQIRPLLGQGTHIQRPPVLLPPQAPPASHTIGMIPHGQLPYPRLPVTATGPGSVGIPMNTQSQFFPQMRQLPPRQMNPPPLMSSLSTHLPPHAAAPPRPVQPQPNMAMPPPRSLVPVSRLPPPAMVRQQPPPPGVEPLTAPGGMRMPPQMPPQMPPPAPRGLVRPHEAHLLLGQPLRPQQQMGQIRSGPLPTRPPHHIGPPVHSMPVPQTLPSNIAHPGEPQPPHILPPLIGPPGQPPRPSNQIPTLLNRQPMNVQQPPPGSNYHGSLPPHGSLGPHRHPGPGTFPGHPLVSHPPQNYPAAAGLQRPIMPFHPNYSQAQQQGQTSAPQAAAVTTKRSADVMDWFTDKLAPKKPGQGSDSGTDNRTGSAHSLFDIAFSSSKTNSRPDHFLGISSQRMCAGTPTTRGLDRQESEVVDMEIDTSSDSDCGLTRFIIGNKDEAIDKSNSVKENIQHNEDDQENGSDALPADGKDLEENVCDKSDSTVLSEDSLGHQSDQNELNGDKNYVCQENNPDYPPLNVKSSVGSTKTDILAEMDITNERSRQPAKPEIWNDHPKPTIVKSSRKYVINGNENRPTCSSTANSEVQRVGHQKPETSVVLNKCGLEGAEHKKSEESKTITTSALIEDGSKKLDTTVIPVMNVSTDKCAKTTEIDLKGSKDKSTVTPVLPGKSQAVECVQLTVENQKLEKTTLPLKQTFDSAVLPMKSVLRGVIENNFRSSECVDNPLKIKLTVVKQNSPDVQEHKIIGRTVTTVAHAETKKERKNSTDPDEPMPSLNSKKMDNPLCVKQGNSNKPSVRKKSTSTECETLASKSEKDVSENNKCGQKSVSSTTAQVKVKPAVSTDMKKGVPETKKPEDSHDNKRLKTRTVYNARRGAWMMEESTETSSDSSSTKQDYKRPLRLYDDVDSSFETGSEIETYSPKRGTWVKQYVPKDSMDTEIDAGLWACRDSITHRLSEEKLEQKKDAEVYDFRRGAWTSGDTNIQQLKETPFSDERNKIDRSERIRDHATTEMTTDPLDSYDKHAESETGTCKYNAKTGSWTTTMSTEVRRQSNVSRKISTSRTTDMGTLSSGIMATKECESKFNQKSDTIKAQTASKSESTVVLEGTSKDSSYNGRGILSTDRPQQYHSTSVGGKEHTSSSSEIKSAISDTALKLEGSPYIKKDLDENGSDQENSQKNISSVKVRNDNSVGERRNCTPPSVERQKSEVISELYSPVSPNSDEGRRKDITKSPIAACKSNDVKQSNLQRSRIRRSRSSSYSSYSSDYRSPRTWDYKTSGRRSYSRSRRRYSRSPSYSPASRPWRRYSRSPRYSPASRSRKRYSRSPSYSPVLRRTYSRSSAYSPRSRKRYSRSPSYSTVSSAPDRRACSPRGSRSGRALKHLDSDRSHYFRRSDRRFSRSPSYSSISSVSTPRASRPQTRSKFKSRYSRSPSYSSLSPDSYRSGSPKAKCLSSPWASSDSSRRERYSNFASSRALKPQQYSKSPDTEKGKWIKSEKNNVQNKTDDQGQSSDRPHDKGLSRKVISNNSRDSSPSAMKIDVDSRNRHLLRDRPSSGELNSPCIEKESFNVCSSSPSVAGMPVDSPFTHCISQPDRISSPYSPSSPTKGDDIEPLSVSSTNSITSSLENRDSVFSRPTLPQTTSPARGDSRKFSRSSPYSGRTVSPETIKSSNIAHVGGVSRPTVSQRISPERRGSRNSSGLSPYTERWKFGRNISPETRKSSDIAHSRGISRPELSQHRSPERRDSRNSSRSSPYSERRKFGRKISPETSKSSDITHSRGIFRPDLSQHRSPERRDSRNSSRSSPYSERRKFGRNISPETSKSSDITHSRGISRPELSESRSPHRTDSRNMTRSLPYSDKNKFERTVSPEKGDVSRTGRRWSQDEVLKMSTSPCGGKSLFRDRAKRGYYDDRRSSRGRYSERSPSRTSRDRRRSRDYRERRSISPMRSSHRSVRSRSSASPAKKPRIESQNTGSFEEQQNIRTEPVSSRDETINDCNDYSSSAEQSRQTTKFQPISSVQNTIPGISSDSNHGDVRKIEPTGDKRKFEQLDNFSLEFLARAQEKLQQELSCLTSTDNKDEILVLGKVLGNSEENADYEPIKESRTISVENRRGHSDETADYEQSNESRTISVESKRPLIRFDLKPGKGGIQQGSFHDEVFNAPERKDLSLFRDSARRGDSTTNQNNHNLRIVRCVSDQNSNRRVVLKSSENDSNKSEDIYRKGEPFQRIDLPSNMNICDSYNMEDLRETGFANWDKNMRPNTFTGQHNPRDNVTTDPAWSWTQMLGNKSAVEQITGSRAGKSNPSQSKNQRSNRKEVSSFNELLLKEQKRLDLIMKPIEMSSSESVGKSLVPSSAECDKLVSVPQQGDSINMCSCATSLPLTKGELRQELMYITKFMEKMWKEPLYEAEAMADKLPKELEEYCIQSGLTQMELENSRLISHARSAIVRQDIQQFESEVKTRISQSYYYGVCSQRVPPEILTKQESQTFFSEDGMFLILCNPIPAKTYQKLLSFKKRLDDLQDKIDLHTQQGNAETLRVYTVQKQASQKERKRQLFTFTGCLSKKRMNKMRVKERYYLRCYNHLRKEYGEAADQMFPYLRMCIDDSANHIAVMTKLRSEEKDEAAIVEEEKRKERERMQRHRVLQGLVMDIRTVDAKLSDLYFSSDINDSFPVSVKSIVQHVHNRVNTVAQFLSEELIADEPNSGAVGQLRATHKFCVKAYEFVQKCIEENNKVQVQLPKSNYPYEAPQRYELHHPIDQKIRETPSVHIDPYPELKEQILVLLTNYLDRR